MTATKRSEKMQDEFVDRWGKTHTPAEGAENLMDRTGAFCLCIANDHILLIWPKNAPNTAEVPGGGVDSGETLWEALVREFHEETGLTLKHLEIDENYTQSVNFYSEKQDEYWYYDQSFYKLTGPTVDVLFFEGERTTPEDGICRWVRLDELDDIEVHHVHGKAINKILNQKNDG